jgi:opacity protein-like surface antigen
MAGSRLLLAFVGVVAASSCWAADEGFYFGLNVGVAEFDIGSFIRPANALLVSQNGIMPLSGGANPGNVFIRGTPATAFILPATTGSSTDDRDTTFSAAVGYTFNRYLSFELSYADLGESTNSQFSTFTVASALQGSNVTFTPLTFRFDQKLSTETLSVSVLGTLPLSERWTLFARGGYGFSESEVKIRASFSAPNSIPAATRRDFKSDDFVAGAGVGFKLSQRWLLRADYERLFDAGAGSLDVDRFGLSAIYRL